MTNTVERTSEYPESVKGPMDSEADRSKTLIEIQLEASDRSEVNIED